MERGFVNTPRGQVHYAAEGSGEPLLLIPQNPRSWRVYTRLAGVLAQKYRVIAMDLPGFGDSDPLPQPFEISDFAQVVRDVLDAFGIKKVRLFGRHTGAMVSGEVAASWPERVEAVVFSGYPFIAGEQERKAHLKLARTPLGAPKGLAVVAPDPSGSHLVKLWHRASMRLWQAKGTVVKEEISEEDMDFIHDLVMDQLKARRTVPASFEAVFRYNAAERLPLVKAPTLLLRPTGDYERDIAQRSDKVKPLVPGSKMVTIPNEDVYTIYWRAQEIGGIVLEFLSDPKSFEETRSRAAAVP